MAKNTDLSANEITGMLLQRIPEHFPFIRIWRNNRITARAMSGGRLRTINAGIDGQADITGIVKLSFPLYNLVFGIKLDIEVKAGTDRLRLSQHAYRSMVQSLGGIYLVCRDPDETLKELEQVLCQYQFSVGNVNPNSE